MAYIGVYFRRTDYAGFWRRLLVDVIDILAVGAACGAMAIVLWQTFPGFGGLIGLILADWAAIVFCYFVLFKRTKGGTLGFRVAGVRIIGIDGRPASLSSLTLRLLCGVFGPLNGLDSIWLAGDPHRQTLRDKLAQTYVVKRNAEPLGTGRIVLHWYEICSYNCLLREVAVPADSSPPSPTPGQRIQVPVQ